MNPFSTASVALLAMLLFPTAGFASAVGTLSNFDVVNDTGESCHGFEIELEDLHPGDVAYTFGGTYIRYGTPEVVDASDATTARTIVRYRHWEGAEWAATPVAPPGVNPRGHDCFSSGPVGNYAASGCEHFGVSLRRQPTKTAYRWLVADDPKDPDTPFRVVPQAVEIPVPVWNVAPVAGGNAVDVRAEVEPVEEEVHAQYGEPQWMKVFKIESEIDLEPEDLVRLLFGAADAILPEETEIETEWKLIQSKPGDAEGEDEDAEIAEDRLEGDKRSVIRRYEFYAYVGPRDPENGEARPCIEDDTPVPGDAPVDGCSDLGDYVGAQNVAVDVGDAPPEPTATATGTVEPEPTPTPTAVEAPCPGDCSDDGQVTVDELITLVNIVLGTASDDACRAGVPAGEPVDIALIVRAIAGVLEGCGAP